jgi:hypothetical protein
MSMLQTMNYELDASRLKQMTRTTFPASRMQPI